MKIILHILLIAVIATACSKPEKTSAQNNGQTTVTYKESGDDFPNPERGFYRYSETRASAFSPLSIDELKQWHEQTAANGGNYSVYSSLVFRYYILDVFKDKPLSDAFLNSIRTDFGIVRAAGFKMIPRFTYTNTQQSGNCGEKFICPLYGDAPKEIVLQHISQLKPVLQENADVTTCVQMGFIGVWGEQYYSDYFGDASSNASQGKLLDNNWNDRIDVLKALLDAVPKDRMIQVRYPQIKQRTIYGIKALTNVAALTASEAFTQTDKARIGFHNDCFLASPDDFGTYEDYGNSSSERKQDISTLKTYTENDSRFVVVGGETCSDGYNPQSDCEPAGIAQTDMAALHYSFLNCAYNNEVNNDWQSGGCMDAIKRNLGYRFVLKTATFPKTVAANQMLSFTIELENKGYASCYNARPVQLILRNKTSGQQYAITTDADPRKWFTGKITWESSVALPDDITKGTYEVFLYLPDKYNSISSRSEYAIRLANVNMWESATGYNKLEIEIAVR